LGVVGRIILKMDLEEVRMGECALDSTGLGQGLVAGSYEHDNEFQVL
jgi:hypothetical protein